MAPREIDPKLALLCYVEMAGGAESLAEAVADLPRPELERLLCLAAVELMDSQNDAEKQIARMARRLQEKSAAARYTEKRAPGSTDDEQMMGREHPRLLRDREWTGPDGTHWRMRGGELDPKQVRRLLRRDGIRVLLVNSQDPELVVGQDLEDLLGRLEDFWSGRAQPMAEFIVGDFRNEERGVLVVVQESC